jgi:anti-sigma-K factor RskA
MSTPHHDLNALAGEYVLGLLSQAEQHEVERQLKDDHVLRAAVAQWRDRMLELDDVADRIDPSPALWARIESGIDAAPRHETSAPRRGGMTSLWSNLGFWRAAGLSGATASLALALGLGVMSMQPAPQPIVVAVMQGSETTTSVIVEAFDDGRIRVVPLGTLEVPAGRTLQVWTLWDRARGPVSMGLMGTQLHSGEFIARDLPVPRPEQLYEISLEPEGGSPTGRPTGPILFKGAAVRPS